MPSPPEKYLLPEIWEESNETGEEVEEERETAKIDSLEGVAADCLKEYYLKKEGVVPAWLDD